MFQPEPEENEGPLGIEKIERTDPIISLSNVGTFCNFLTALFSKKKCTQGTGEVTNQRAELTAIHTAIDLCSHIDNYEPKMTHIHLFTDSMYCINCLTNWCYTWEHNEWKTTNGKGVKNRDIIEPLLVLIRKHRVIFYHAQAHTDKTDTRSQGNAVADYLATKATKSASSTIIMNGNGNQKLPKKAKAKRRKKVIAKNNKFE